MAKKKVAKKSRKAKSVRKVKRAPSRSKKKIVRRVKPAARRPKKRIKRIAARKVVAKRRTPKVRKKVVKRAAKRIRVLPALKRMELRELAAFIGSKLHEVGLDPVLVGKACCALYLGSRIPPASIEFVICRYEVKEVAEVMAGLGLESKGMHLFKGADLAYEVNVLAPPLSVGDEIVCEVKTIKTKCGELKLLTPNDCVRSRLSMYYRWGDRKRLEEAVAVSKRFRSQLNIEGIRRWSEWEWCSDKFAEYLAELGK